MPKSSTQAKITSCPQTDSNEAPLKGVGRDGTKYPKHFSVKVPVLKGDGILRRDGEGKPVFKTEYGVLSCYIIVHQDKWKSIHTEKRRSEESAVEGDSIKEGL